jgi:formylglycine-generating enzyme required for sulfatase activity/tRNA A-37 threonylcarbamoyl transferase component Bud32
MVLDDSSVGQYNIVKQIGKGGMATVYKAYQSNLDRYVAVKVLSPELAETEDFIARFEREARAIARLRHRNILTVFDYGCQEGVFYLVMEYVSGGILRDRLGWPQDLGYAVGIISQVGDALAYAHRQGMVHRDVKPANILMAEEDWPLLSDFGLAKLVEDSIQLTASGAGVGTPQYMSPEQAQGLAVDRRSDIYSLGVMLYEAVTGRPPFGTDSPMAVILRHINEPVPSPRTLRSDLPEAMERTILKTLAKSPADRYQRMEEFLVDLRGACPFPVSRSAVHRGSAPAARKTASTPSSRPTLPRRRSFPWAGLALGVILLLILVLAFLFFKVATTPQIPPTTAAVAAMPGPSAATSTPPPAPQVSPSATAAVAETPGPPAPTSPPTVTTTPQTIKVQVWEADGAEMVFVPAGEFVMGSEDLGDDERPAHRVYLDGFWIDRYEVTNERFARFADATGYRAEAETRGWGWLWNGSEWEEVEGADWRHPRGPGSSIEDKMDHPVALVSWNDADAYCRWAGKRLPSEAQWEKAARGPATERGRSYAWGDKFNIARANTRESERGDTAPVGSFSPQGDSPYGASDMTGNVWEWVADWYGSDYYSQSPLADPAGPITGTYKVLRGGSWLFDEVYARTAFRYNVKPDYTYDFAGFRCSGQ